MKKITILCIALFSITYSFSQKVAIVGMNHLSPDGFSFVVTEAFTNGDVMYFTEDEYNNSTNVFSSGESVVKFTANTAIAVGTVVFVKEISGDVFTISCSGGGSCGSASELDLVDLKFAFGSSGESLYAYSDTDDDPTNGLGTGEIYALMYTKNTALPALEDPTVDFPNAIVVDGFASGAPNRTEFNVSRDGVSQVTLENPSNYTNGSSNADLLTTTFTNLNLSGTNPVLTVTRTPATLNENSGSSFTYTFMLDANATSNITVNFNVSGDATFNTDYSVTGAATFNASTGTAVISNGTNSKAITITPTGDSIFEPDETVTLTLTAGTGYDAGSPSVATSTILNDDTKNVTPVVAVTGTNQSSTNPPVEGFSFVVLDDLTGGEEVYFTERPFNNSTLQFSGSEAVLKWVAPAITRGNVIFVKETSTNTYTVTCSGGGSCGTITHVSGNFDLASQGEAFSAYSDSNNNPNDGITDYYGVLFTGTSSTPGGNIPSIEDPSADYLGVVVVDGFAATAAKRTEYKFVAPARSITVDQADFQNTGNWLHSETIQDLSIVPFTNIIISSGSANPTATVTISPSSVLEDSGTGMVYTFALDAASVGATVINFTVGGSATLTNDYTVSGATSFNASTGSVTIADTTTSATVTITPVADSDVEIQETVELMIASGTGYDGGSPNAATATITNDDTSLSDPLVAITGLNHVTPDGFSFVAAKAIPTGTEIYFTEDEYDNTTLLFSSGEAVLKWTAPAAGIPTGDVIVVTETAPDVFSLTCNGASGGACGTIALISGNLATSTNGETFYAYEDDDNDPTNGVTDIYAVLYTGNPTTPGGNIPAVQDPSGIYLSALVVDGFPAGAPNRTEYKFAGGERGIPVGQADFEDVSNWLNGQANQALSPIPFAALAIIDATPPTALCKNITVQLDANGNASITGADVDNGSSDNIGIASLSVSPNSFDCTDVGTPVSVTLTVTDAAGNTATCMATVTVQDNIPVSITCPGNQTENPNASCQFILPDYTGLAVANDNCGTPTVTQSPTAGTLISGNTTVTLKATGGDGSTKECTFDVILNDTTAPTAVCKNIDVFLDGTGSASIVAADIDGGSTDNCSGVTLSASQTAFTCANLGPNNVTLTVKDSNNNIANCIAVVTVIDNIDPVVTCPADIVVGNDDGQCGAIVNFMASATDNCSNVTTSSVPTSGSLFPVGITVVTVTANDNNGNTKQCSFKITVNDTEKPKAFCKTGVVAYLDANGNASITAEQINNNSTDNCGIASISVSPNTFNCNQEGTNVPVTLTVTDINGNVSTCNTTVEVDDKVLPDAVCKNITVELDANGNASISPNDVNGGSSDNCGWTRALSVTPNTFDCTNLGPNTVIMKVGDGNGNQNTCTAIVTIVDKVDPSITCLNPAPVNNAPGKCEAYVVVSIPSTGDNCQVKSLTNDYTNLPSANGFYPVGITTVTWTVTDTSGNTTDCSVDVVVNDNQPPVAPNPPTDVSVQCASDVPPPIDLTASDNCGNITVSPSAVITPGNCENQFKMVRTWTFVDSAGNQSSVSQTINVNDTIAPVKPIPPAGVNVQCAADVPSPVDLTANDNCDGDITVSPSAVITPGNCENQFKMVRTWTFTDGCGNSSSVSQIINVSDTAAPVKPIPPVEVNVQCASDVPPPVNLTAVDNCDGDITVSPSAVITPGNCENQFKMVRTWTFTDGCGNSSSVSQIINVSDTTAPVKPIPPVEVNVQCAADVPPPVNLTAVDNCDGDITVSPSAVITPGNCENQFKMVRTWTFTDGCGNSSSVSQTISVNDDTPPTIDCLAEAINFPGCNPTRPTVDDAVSSVVVDDNCGIKSVIATPGSVTGDCYKTQIFNVVVTDLCGNAANCDVTYTWFEDFEAPIVTSQNERTIDIGCNPAEADFASGQSFIDKGFITVTDDCNATLPVIVLDRTEQINIGCKNFLIYYYKATDDCGNTTPLNKMAKVTYQWEEDDEPACDVAFARYKGADMCFADDSDSNSNQTGWTNYFEAPGEYIMQLFAGVSDCDVINSDNVGKVVVDYTGDYITLNFVMYENYVMGEAYVNIGCEKYPLDNSGQMTTDSDHFNYRMPDLEHVRNYTVGPINVSQTNGIYVIAEAVTCLQKCDCSVSPYEAGSYPLDGDNSIVECKIADETLSNNSTENSPTFKAYPVPFENDVFLEYKFNYETDVTIEVFDVKGALIKREINTDYNAGVTSKTKMDFSNLSDQLYFVKLTTSKGTGVKKIVSN